MKKLLSLILLAGMLSAPSYAAEGVSLATVTAMAQPDSGASLDKLCMAVYELAKEQPDKAVDIFQHVISQRSSWNVTETYAILRSVLLAVPALESSFVNGAALHQKDGYSAATVTAQGYRLLSALYTMPQTQAVASTVVHGVLGSSLSGMAAGNGTVAENIYSYVPIDVSPTYTVTPTPPPTSPNN